MHNDVAARKEEIDKVRANTRQMIRREVEQIKEALAKRLDELASEIDRRCKNDHSMCDHLTKMARDMQLLSSYVSFNLFLLFLYLIWSSDFRSAA